jgi:hypothetical protein
VAPPNAIAPDALVPLCEPIDGMNLLPRHLPRIMLLLAAFLAGCAGDRNVTSPTSGANLLMNASFEDGRDPWFALVTANWAGFEVTDRHAVSGQHSAHLALRAGEPAEGTRIVGVIQEASPRDLPRRLSGFYRVEGWIRGTPKQYLQVVVIVFGDPGAKPYPNHQIRYVLGGVDRPPLQIANAKYSFAGASELQEGRWSRFDLDLHADFQRQWGQVPKDFSKIRVLFEVRYDEKEAGAGEPKADVYYDDLYLGE